MKSDIEKRPTVQEVQEGMAKMGLSFPSPSQFHRVEFRKGVDPKAVVAEMTAKLRAERSKRP